MCGDFRGLGTSAPGAFQVLPDLLAARARCVQILLRVTLDLGRPASTSGNLVAELAKSEGQLGLVDRSCKLLRGKETLRLQGTVLAVLPFSHVEDDDVCVELWREITVYGPGGVVLKLSCDESCCRLRRVVPADPCLGVVFKLLQCDANTLPMGIRHAV